MFKLSRFFRIYFVVVVLLLLFICGFFLIKLSSNVEPIPDPIEIAKKCFFHNGRNPNATGKSITFFEDLLTSKLPEFDRGIFFVETQCSSNGIADLKPRFNRIKWMQSHFNNFPSIFVLQIRMLDRIGGQGESNA